MFKTLFNTYIGCADNDDSFYLLPITESKLNPVPEKESVANDFQLLNFGSFQDEPIGDTVIKDASTKGGSIKDALTKGGSIKDASTKGESIKDASTKGGSIKDALTKGESFLKLSDDVVYDPNFLSSLYINLDKLDDFYENGFKNSEKIIKSVLNSGKCIVHYHSDPFIVFSLNYIRTILAITKFSELKYLYENDYSEVVDEEFNAFLKLVEQTLFTNNISLSKICLYLDIDDKSNLDIITNAIKKLDLARFVDLLLDAHPIYMVLSADNRSLLTFLIREIIVNNKNISTYAIIDFLLKNYTILKPIIDRISEMLQRYLGNVVIFDKDTLYSMDIFSKLCVNDIILPESYVNDYARFDFRELPSESENVLDDCNKFFRNDIFISEEDLAIENMSSKNFNTCLNVCLGTESKDYGRLLKTIVDDLFQPFFNETTISNTQKQDVYNKIVLKIFFKIISLDNTESLKAFIEKFNLCISKLSFNYLIDFYKRYCGKNTVGNILIGG